MSEIKVLYAEDELALAQIVSESLATRGFDVRFAPDGQKALETFDQSNPDICILDIMMPRMDGYSVARNIRAKSPHIPIIFLTAKTQTKDVLKGFESGGNDFIRKPFSVEELIVRIHNLLNLHGGSSNQNKAAEQFYKIGSWQFYPRRFELIRDEEINRLSHRQAKLLEHLCLNKNDTSYRKEILISIWGDDTYYNSRTLDVYINKLRKLFKSEKGIEIITLKGVGYLFRRGE